MNLRCVFHVSPAMTTAAQVRRERQPLPTSDVENEIVDLGLPRGRSFETWVRARGWSSED